MCLSWRQRVEAASLKIGRQYAILDDGELMWLSTECSSGTAITTESYALVTAPYKVLRCAPTARIAPGSSVSLLSARLSGVGVRETLTAPRPSAAIWAIT